jgi:hypothetical protein
MSELTPSTLTTLVIGGNPWSVVSVVSPYTPDLHVMVLEANPDCYLPAPENMDPEEGEALMALWTSITSYLGARDTCSRLCVGFNWSPRAWGEMEERGGYQSLPTKWHPMFWSWPSMPEVGASTEYARWVQLEELPRPVRRILGENSYVKPISSRILDKIQAELSSQKLSESWKADTQGLSASIKAASLGELFDREGTFARFLLPIAQVMESVMRAMTESLTSMRFSEYDELLKRTESGTLSSADIAFLRSPPQVVPYPDAELAWIERSLPQELLPELHAAADRRCRETSPEEDWWRKGFGYALVLTEDCGEGTVGLRIMPGVYVGPGGVVEAQRVVLRRSEDKSLETAELMRKSGELWKLAGVLEDTFPRAQEDTT